MFMHYGSHGIINRRHHLVSHLNNAHLSACVMQVFGHFQTDESAAYNHSAFNGVALHIILDKVCISHIAQGENALTVDS